MKYGYFDSGLRICAIIAVMVFGSLLTASLVFKDNPGNSGLLSPAFNLNRVAGIPEQTDYHDWKAVIIHHSGTQGESSAAMRRRYRMLGFERIPFHFLIHPDGSADSTEAWKLQTPVSQILGEKYFNTVAIGICVIGDFSVKGSKPALDQMTALIQLTRYLMDTFEIKKVNVLPCSDVDDTLSPGEYFPWQRFLYSLR